MNTWKSRHSLLPGLGIAVVGLLFFALGSLRAQSSAESEPVIEAAILPSASQPAAATEPALPDYGPLPKAKSVEAGLKLDNDERQILSAAHVKAAQIDEPGLYVLLRRAAALPELTQGQFEQLNKISIPTLKDDPAKFRGVPLRLKMKVYLAKKWMPGKEFQRSMRWPSDRPVWWLSGLEVSNGIEKDREIIAISVTDPMEMLGKPSSTDEFGRSVYGGLGRDLDIAGIFYNDIVQETRGGPKEEPASHEYPVFVAWQIVGQPQVSLFEEFNGFFAAPLAVILVILVFLFFWMRKKNKSRLPVGKRNYRPLRDDPDTQADTITDPALKDAAEQFKKHKPEGQ